MHMDVDDDIFRPRFSFGDTDDGPPNDGDGGRPILGDGTILALARAGDTNALTASGERVAAAAAVAAMVVRMLFIV
jgi:hypothetical protein